MIGWYVHHHGAGHLRRMEAVTEYLSLPVTVLSSLPRPEGIDVDWVRLDRDDDLALDLHDANAGGTLHWAPRGHAGLVRRTAQLTRWLDEARPSLVVVDVSVEVALLVRLAGVPVVVVAMPGDRSDRPHSTAYDLADALLAPWPDHVPSAWPQRWVDKACFVGAMSRFDGRPRPALDPAARAPRALLLWGEGGDEREADFDALLTATPGWEWRIGRPGHRLGAVELWSALCEADVVVTHAGQGSVGDVACAGTPAVVVADPRPFDEQIHTVRALSNAGIAVGLEDWPDATRWPALLEQARELGGLGWRTWSGGEGAAVAARAVEAWAGRVAVTPEDR